MANSRFYRNTSSLALRVLFVCLAFLVIPLIIFAFLLSNKETRLQKSAQEMQLSLLSQGVLQLTGEWVALKEAHLTTLSHLLSEETDANTLLTQFAGDSTLFVVDGGIFTASSDRELVGKKAALQSAKLQLFTLAAGQPPSIVLMQGNLGFAMEAASWLHSLARLEEGMTPFSLALIDEKEQVISETAPAEATEVKKTVTLPEATFKIEVILSPEALERVEGVRLLDSLVHFLFLLLFLGGGCAIWLTVRMARPLKQLHKVMDRVGEGEIDARYQEDSLGFEINQIGGHFNQTVDALTQQRLAKEILAKELAIGHEIQKSLFPKEIPHAPGLQMAAGFLPAREVAGDFYDLFFRKEDQLFIAIADASDKGISACLYSLLLRSLLRSQVLVQDDLAEAIFKANKLFCKDTGETGNFATAWLALLDIRSRQLTYCNAGHPPALLLRENGPIQELNHGVGALGISELATRPVLQTIQLHKGDQLLLITDGVTEAQNLSGQFYGKRALYDFVEGLKNKTPRESVDLLFKEIEQFTQGADRSDDLTALAVKIT